MNRTIVLAVIVAIIASLAVLFYSPAFNPEAPPPNAAAPIRSETSGVLQPALKGPDEMEFVEGMWVRKDRDCTVYADEITDDEGVTSTIHRCEPNNPKPQHAYADLGIGTLKEMAYRDSEAAEILGIMLIENGDEEAGLQSIYRAVALTGGKSDRAIQRAHNTFYGTRAFTEDGELKPAIAEMEQAYVFAVIRERLTGRRATGTLRKELERAGYEDFDKLEVKASTALATMAAIEIEVVGDRSIQEKIDA